MGKISNTRKNLEEMMVVGDLDYMMLGVELSVQRKFIDAVRKNEANINIVLTAMLMHYYTKTEKIELQKEVKRSIREKELREYLKNLPQIMKEQNNA